MASEQVNPIADPSQLGEVRAAPRVTLLLRLGKLVVDGAEYPCVLRDVSHSGIRVRLFRSLRAGKAYELELGFGTRFAIEPVWQRDGEAGFRFCDGPVDLARIVEEHGSLPRRQLRLRLARPIPIGLITGETTLPGLLHDLSQHGARVEAGPGLALRQAVSIELPTMPPILARLRWRRLPEHGLVFDHGYQLAELAALIDHLHKPLRSPPGVASLKA